MYRAFGNGEAAEVLASGGAWPNELSGAHAVKIE